MCLSFNDLVTKVAAMVRRMVEENIDPRNFCERIGLGKNFDFCPTSTGEFLDVPDGYDQVDIFRMLMRCLGGVRERRKRRQKYDLAGTIQLIKEAKKILVLTGAGISGTLVLHYIISYKISSFFDKSISDKNDTKVNPLLQYPVAFPTSVPVMAFMLN